jgi:hypothetical protein
MNMGNEYKMHTFVKFVLHYRGIDYKCIDDLGENYPLNVAHYIYEEGNYSCDCNRSLFLKRIGVVCDELECGETIKLSNLEIFKAFPI